MKWSGTAQVYGVHIDVEREEQFGASRAYDYFLFNKEGVVETLRLDRQHDFGQRHVPAAYVDRNNGSVSPGRFIGTYDANTYGKIMPNGYSQRPVPLEHLAKDVRAIREGHQLIFAFRPGETKRKPGASFAVSQQVVRIIDVSVTHQIDELYAEGLHVLRDLEKRNTKTLEVAHKLSAEVTKEI